MTITKDLWYEDLYAVVIKRVGYKAHLSLPADADDFKAGENIFCQSQLTGLHSVSSTPVESML